MKPFDIDAARAGKSFGKTGDWKQGVTRTFLGVLSNGDIAYEYKDPSTRHPLVVQAHPDQLFMLPEKKSVKFIVIQLTNGLVVSFHEETLKGTQLLPTEKVLGEFTFEYEE